MTQPLRLGTRGSALARTQSEWVAAAVRASSGRDVELVIIKTLGDVQAGPLAAMPQSGVFVSALRHALLEGEVDFLVHSMKDLPSEPETGIVLAAVPQRADRRDALLTSDRTGLAGLPHGARVGTSSPRRAARLRSVRPDLDISDLRGNVDSRVAKVRSGELDATVLAVAGLARLGRADEIDEVIEPAVMLPAPAQGALAIECRTYDADIVAILGALDVAGDRLATTAERAVLSAVSATCASAIGASAVLEDGHLVLTADVSGTAPGEYVSRVERTALSGDEGADLGRARDLGGLVGRLLLAAGAAAYVNPTSAHE